MLNFGRVLPDAFFSVPTEDVARALLGKLLVHNTAGGVTAGRIVETEAYLCENDPACHAARGQTRRNAAMFGREGTAYIYLIYGIHYCFNVVTGPGGVGEAVLIRALEPICGLELMAARRGAEKKLQLASGPGKLCCAMGIGLAQNGTDLLKEPLFLADDGYKTGRIASAGRIGISVAAELPLRFYLDGNPYISRK